MTDRAALADLAVDEARKAGATYAEARAERGGSEAFVLKNGNPEISDRSVYDGISVRVLARGALGFASTNDLAPKKVMEIAKRAVRLALGGSKRRKSPIKFSQEKAEVAAIVLKPKRALKDVPAEERIAYLMNIEKSMPKEVAAPARFFAMYTSTSEKIYRNSEGSRISQSIPRAGMFAFVTVMDPVKKQTEQAMLQYGKAAGWEYLERLGAAEKIGEEAKMLAKVIREGVKAPTEEAVDIVVGPEISGIAAHESCGHPFEADRILGREGAQAGESHIKPDSLGKRIGSDAVTIVDDPTVEGTYGWYAYDDEGVKARRRVLIEKGMIAGFLQNRDTGTTFKTGSNAAARANSYEMEPIIRMSNTFFLPGTHTEEELLEGIRKGVYIKTFTEWNIDDRRYNQRYVGREAYMIENGKLGAMVRRPVIEMTAPAFDSAVDAASKKVERNAANCGKGDPMQGIPVDHGGPHLRLRGVRLGSGVK
jgi:TldD protein